MIGKTSPLRQDRYHHDHVRIDLHAARPISASKRSSSRDHGGSGVDTFGPGPCHRPPPHRRHSTTS